MIGEILFCRKSGQTYQAIMMLEKCIWLQPRFVQAHVELVTMKPENEKQKILIKLLKLEPHNWEHYVLYGDWLRSRGMFSSFLYFLGFGNRKWSQLMYFEINWGPCFQHISGKLLKKILSLGLPAPAAKYYLEATRLSFRSRSLERTVRSDLITFRYTALMYRSLGQKSRTLQLLTRLVKFKIIK